MHVVVAKKDLFRVLARCQGVADKKSTMPVLGNVLLEVSGTDQSRLAVRERKPKSDFGLTARWIGVVLTRKPL